MGGSSKQKTQSQTTNPFAIQQYNSAVSQLGNSQYSPLSGDQIQQYMNPYISNVADTTMQQLEKSRLQARNANTDQAIAAKAFSGSGRDVANAITDTNYDQNAASILSQLYSGGYNQALGAAQTENAAANQYPLLIQQLLGNMAQGTQQNSNSTSKVKQGIGMGDIGTAIQVGGQIAGMFSDRRLKRDIEPLGERMGRMWYRFKYLWSDQVYEGVMAQENPDIAFKHPSGFLMVDYGRLA